MNIDPEEADTLPTQATLSKRTGETGKKEKIGGKQNVETGEKSHREADWCKENPKPTSEHDERNKQNKDNVGSGQMEGALIEETTQNIPAQ